MPDAGRRSRRSLPIAMAESAGRRRRRDPRRPRHAEQSRNSAIRRPSRFDDADAPPSTRPPTPPSTNGTSFRWPVRGRIISGFGTKPNGERNDGINLAVPEGTSVKAAEAGTVIYAGNELEGYGNLVLVRHADGWVSAYAHNSDAQVKRGDTGAPRPDHRARRHERLGHLAAGAFRAAQGRQAGQSARPPRRRLTELAARLDQA